MTYSFLQQYWWFLVSLLGGLLVFLMFVQGANSLIFRLGRDEEERKLIIGSTGRKWELTFTTLVTFGGAFFASFPLFYSTSFGGAYWVWMLILVSFVLQAVAYEFQTKPGNVLGRGCYRRFLVFNGVVGPFVVGAAVATFFTGSNFLVTHDALGLGVADAGPVISRWGNAWHGLDALFCPWNWVLGLAVVFLTRVLGSLYLLNNLHDEELRPRLRRQVLIDTVPFLVLFLAFVGRVLTATGLVYDATTQTFAPEAYRYLHSFLSMPLVALLFLVGVVLVLLGILRTLLKPSTVRGIWFTGIGTVLTVTALLLVAGLDGTAYYPSSLDPQSSLCLANSCSSEFTLTVMSVVSLLIPFVLAYIAYAWHAIDLGGLSRKDA
ncbi:MAG: cytochrome d ubiquinol oxidase subunit II [Bacteroidales bacterium]|nr:cytochrome d ubiquinol oxidase subunit II [Bacteroidales bacterium]MDD7726499.1 cytochrome d ubiquinol oxidase subunit II [Bacteroidales bacterium]MDY4620432.1 cytochrome d ubiquinol oxidase subunit II [Alloprevotella sp.]